MLPAQYAALSEVLAITGSRGGNEVRWSDHRDEAFELEDGVYRTDTAYK